MKQVRVFLVDDDKDFAETLEMVLEVRGYDVEIAYSGEEAIAKFREQDFDIAFMDVKLPGKNGVESFLEIQKMKPDVKVVMMTGYSVEQLLGQAVNNGAWGILRKPFRMQQVLEMVEKLGADGILIADDDADFVESIKTLLQNHNYTVFVARNGREALERILSNGVDILILDLKMPILNGLETYLELKKVGCIVPTIIVTAYADEYAEDLDRLRSLSVSAILKKPFDPRELLEVVAQISSTHEKNAT